MRSLVGLAALVIVLGAVKMSASLIVPLLMAATLTVAFQPLARHMARLGWPPYVSAITTCFAVLSVLAGASCIVVRAVDGLAEAMPRYQASLAQLRVDTAGWFDDRGLADAARSVRGWEPGAYLLGELRLWIVEIGGMVQVLFLVVLITVFVQLEASSYRRKLARVLGSTAPLRHTAAALADVQRYMAVKLLLGLANGVLLGLWCHAWGVSNALLWGVMAFLLNFVPVVGSLLAAVPPVLISLVEGGPATSLGVAAGYAMVNLLVDNILEPRVMGRALDLSPLVVLVSMLVWGFVLGPVGALLSVPLTLGLRALLSRTDDLRWVADLLGAAQSPTEVEPSPPRATVVVSS